ncbi:MAG TPA: TetR/AcrR family transcriptional regulator [Polyangiaceae bacterium]|nr:TetR/AcrR family transcriptional regulator [Polyangiaceae bacterium]
MKTSEANKKRTLRRSKLRARVGGRSARVVRDVLAAALQVFAERGYAGLSMEEVAARANVNKTTVYRRWPTKSDLVGAALFTLRDEDPDPPDTGSLREDLFITLKLRAAQLGTAHRRAILNALLMSKSEPELQSLIEKLRRERPFLSRDLFERAIARQELPPDANIELLSEALLGPLHHRVHWKQQTISDEFLRALVHLIVSGAQASSSPEASSKSR